MLYQPTFVTPYLSAIDVTVANTFSFQIEGNQCVAYRLKIFLLSNLAVAVYDTNKVTLSSTKYSTETIEIIVPSSGNGMTNGNEYVWSVSLYETATSSAVISQIYYFKALKTPVIDIDNFVSTVSEKSFEFTGTYSQEQNVSIKYFIFNLYNGYNELIETTDKVFSSDVKYSFDGFLSEQSYGIELIIENQENVIVTTGKMDFDVSYFSPSINSKANTEVLNNKSSIKITWDEQNQVFGKSTGEYTILNNIPYSGAHSVNIENGEIYWDTVNEKTPILVPDTATTMISVNFPVGFTGKIIELKNTVLGNLCSIQTNGNVFSWSIRDSNNITVFGTRTIYSFGDVSFPSSSLTVHEDRRYMWNGNSTWDNSKYWVEGVDLLNKYFWKITILPTSVVFYKVEV